MHETRIDAADCIMKRIAKEASLIPGKRKAYLSYNNLGDFYSLCTALQYAEQVLGIEYVLLYCSDSQKNIAKWFSYDGYEIHLYKITKDEYNILFGADNAAKREYEDLISFIGSDEKLHSLVFNTSLQYGQELRPPHINEIDKDSYIEKYRIIPGKTIIIIPSSKCLVPFPDWFWNFSAEIFKFMGYKVLFNAPDNEKDRWNGDTLFINVCDMPGIADLCGNVFSVRTGLLDVISSSTAQMMIFSTEAFRPIDEVYKIPNADKRIRTFFYEKGDLFFEKTKPLNYIFSAFNKRREATNDILYSVFKYIYLQGKIGGDRKLSDAHLLNAYSYKNYCNKCDKDSRFAIQPFVDVKYSLYIDDSILIFTMPLMESGKYRYDITIRKEEKWYWTVTDYRENTLMYELTEDGRYSVDVCITSVNTLAREYFTTEAIRYSASRGIQTISTFSDYINKLLDFSSDLIIFIAVRDTCVDNSNRNAANKLLFLNSLGLKEHLNEHFRHSYAAVIDGGNVVLEEFSSDSAVRMQYSFGEHNAELVSEGWNVKKYPAPINITIDGSDYAINRRGINIVVWNKKEERVIDSVCFDFFYCETTMRLPIKNDI